MEPSGSDYARQVVLVLEASGTPVAFAALAVGLARFAPAARKQILAARALGLRGPLLYGRRRTLFDRERRPSAEIVEIPS